MLNTTPVYGDQTQLGATKVFVKFKEARLQDINHHIGEDIGSQLILVNFNNLDSTWTLTYVNSANMVLKRISYARESVLEVTWEESVCRIAPPIKPPLKAV